MSEDRGVAQIAVVTTSLVLTADVDVAGVDVDVDNPFVLVVPWSAIESFKVREAGVDVEGSRKLAWPQSQVIAVKCRGLHDPAELRGAALVQHDPARIAPTWRLLGELRSDLTDLTPPA